jgi:hypothetical protein
MAVPARPYEGQQSCLREPRCHLSGARNSQLILTAAISRLMPVCCCYGPIRHGAGPRRSIRKSTKALTLGA